MRVLERACDTGRHRQRAGEAAAALYIGFRPDELLHRVLGLDPGAARFAPAGRGSDSEFKTLSIGGPDGVGERVLPLRRHVGQALGHDLGGEQAGVEILHAADAHARHPLEILVDPFLRDIAVHPMPPDAWPGALWRVAEAVGQFVGEQRAGEGGAGEEQREAQGAGLH
jgi:hypothetical protein